MARYKIVCTDVNAEIIHESPYLLKRTALRDVAVYDKPFYSTFVVRVRDSKIIYKRRFENPHDYAKRMGLGGR